MRKLEKSNYICKKNLSVQSLVLEANTHV